MKHLILLILYLFSFSLFAQTNIDSLEALLPNKNGLEKVILLNKLGYEYWKIAPEKGLEYANTAYDMALNEESKVEIAKALENIGINNWAKSELNLALEYNFKALKIYEEINYLEGISATYNNLGTVYLDLFDYENALKYNFKSQKISQENGFTYIYILTLSNISSIYLAQEDYKKAEEYIQEAIEVSEKENIKINLGSQQTTLGEIYKLEKNYKKAKASYKKALEIFKKENNNYGIAISLYNIAEVEYYLKDLGLSLSYYNESAKLSQKINDQIGVLLSNKGIGQVYKEQKKYKEALMHYDISLKLSNKLKSKKDKLDIYKDYSELYKAMGSYDKALEYLEKHNQLKDSISNESISNEIAEMQTKYGTEKKDKENELLRKNNQIQELELAKQTNIRNSFIALTLLVVLLIIILYSRFSIKKKNNKQLILNNEIISKQRDELKQINSTKDKFFSIISHDLRGPFGNIVSFTNLLTEDYDSFTDQEKKEIIGQLNNSAKSTFELLANLLTWSQTQTGQIEINKENLNLKNLIDTSCAAYVPVAAQKNIDITCKVPKEANVYVDKNTASVIIVNLINNAIKFTPDKGTITVDYVDQKEYSELHIIDAGVGMSKETISKLFKIEENISTKGTNNEDGTGLGLILSKEFITKNGGNISVTSEPGKGSHFIVSFPKQKSA